MVGEHTNISFVLNIRPPLTERQEDCSDDKRGQKTIHLWLTCRRASRSNAFHPAGFADSSAGVFLHEREVQGLFFPPLSQEQWVTHLRLYIVDNYENLISTFSDKNMSFVRLFKLTTTLLRKCEWLSWCCCVDIAIECNGWVSEEE